MKRWVRHSGLLLGVIATAAFAAYAARTLREQDLSQFVSIQSISGIVIAAIGSSLIIPLSAFAWQRLLRDVGVSKSWGELSIIMSVTQLAKYLPGNVGQHIGRAAMSIGRGIPLRPYSVSVIVEAVLALVAAIITGVAGCGLSGMGTAILEQHGTMKLSTIVILAGALLLAIILARHAIPLLLRRLKSKHGMDDGRNMLPRNGALAFALITYVLNYAVLGVGVTIMAMLLLPSQPPQWLLLTGSFALAWVIGFLAPGAPAGLGVREGLMLGLLQFSYSAPDALLLVIALRLATTLGDILCFFAGSGALFLAGRRASAHAANNLR